MAVIQETIRAGRIVFRKITGRKEIEKGKKRAKKSKPTIEDVERNNQRYAERDLMLKINHNFKPDDLHAVFTYQGIAPTPEAAYKYLQQLKRKLRELYKKRGITLKWIETTEYENQRIHHHFIITGEVDLIEIKNAWGRGKVMATALYAEGDYRNLASYIIKETSKSIKSDDPFSAKRYRCSRTIQNPPVYREEVRASKLLDDPKPIKGYYIDMDSVHRGVNPVTDRQYIEFFMLPIEGERQAVKINGKKRRYKRENNDIWLKKHKDRQMEIDLSPAIVG